MFQKADRKKSRRLWQSVIFTLCYIVFHIFIAIHHEAWRDEGQSWMLVKNASVTEMLSLLCVEGHPALWFFTIMPLVKMGLPFKAFSTISVLFMGICVFLLMYKSPFSDAINLLIPFSTVFFYFNPVIPRIYSEALLVLVLIAIMYDKRDDYPWGYGLLLLLLSQTHVLFAGVTGALLFERMIHFFIADKKRTSIIPSVFGAVGGILAIAELYPREGTKRSVEISVSQIFSSIDINVLDNRIRALFKNLWGSFGTDGRIIGDLYLCFLFVILFMILLEKIQVIEKIIGIVTIFISLCFPLFVVMFIYPAVHVQIASVFLMIIFFIAWIMYNSNLSKHFKMTILAGLIVFSLLSFPVAIEYAAADISGEYSNSRKISEYIIDNVELDAIIFVEDTEYNSAVYCYVTSERDDILFYSITDYQEYNYHTWGDPYIPYTGLNVKLAKEELFPYSTVYFLRTSPLEDDYLLNDIASWAYDETPSGETYFLYKI